MDECLAVGAGCSGAEGGFGIECGGEVAWPSKSYFLSRVRVRLGGVGGCPCVL